MANGTTVAQVKRAGTNTALDIFRKASLERLPDVARALAGTIDPEKFIEIGLTAIATVPKDDLKEKLLNCTPESFVLAVLKSAQTGLALDGRQAALVPYGRIATFTPMVRGRILLIQRAPKVAKVVTRAVLDCDEFEYELGTTERIHHKPALDPPADAKLTHAYAIVFWKDGTPPTFEVLTRARIEEIRTKMAKMPDSPAWKNSYNQMAEKCALNRVERLIDTDPDTALRMAHAIDAEFTVEDGAPVDMAAAVTDRVTDQVDEARRRLAEIQERQKIKQAEPTAMIHLEETLMRGLNAGVVSEEGERKVREALDSVSAELVAKSQAWLDGKLQAAAQEPQPAQEPDGAPEPSGPAQPEAAAPDEAQKDNPLVCLEVGGVIHLSDPTAKTTASRPASCIGCGAKLGSNQYATAAEPTEDPTRYCPKALAEVDAKWSAERVPDAVLVAVLAGVGA